MDPYPLAAFTVLKPIHAPLSRYRMKDVDAHSHVDRYDLVDEQARGSALTEITQHDILTVSNSMDLPCYKQNLEISEMFNLALPTFGVHPWNALDYADRPDDLREGVGATPMLGEI
jgi:TatD DNase family protein